MAIPIMEMKDKVAAYIQQEDLIRKGQTVGCAVSGGADSVALFLCLHELTDTLGFSLHVLHFEHGIRGEESRQDARFVEKLCRERNVPVHLTGADIPDLAKRKHLSLELTARQARHDWFASLHDAGIVSVVATAHHLNDNAETQLLHLIRGSGVDGLAGIRPKRSHLIRPFLCVDREEITAFLKERGQTWREDSTNRDLRLTRNYVRHELLPRMMRLNPGIASALARLARTAAQDADCLEALSAELTAQHVTYRNGSAEIDAAALAGMHPALGARVLRQTLAAIGRTLDVEHAHIRALLFLAAGGKTGAALDLGSGFTARLSYGRLLLTQISPVSENYLVPFVREGVTRFPGGLLEGRYTAGCGVGRGCAEYLNADCLTAETVVRTRQPGDVFHPLGAPGKKKLKDYFIDIKLPREKRSSVPLLADGPRILWVIGHRLSQEAAVTRQTRQILHVKYTPLRI